MPKDNISDKTQFDILFEPIKNKLHNYALKLSKTSNVDGDIVFQEAITKAFDHFDQFQEGTNFGAWMHTITFNTFVNHDKKNRSLPITVNDEESILESKKTEDSPEDNYFREQDKQLIEKAYDMLDENKQQMIYYYFYMNLKYKEIAVILDLPIGTVMSRLSRAKNALKKNIETVRLASMNLLRNFS